MSAQQVNAAQSVLEAQLFFAQAGRNLATAALAGAKRFVAWQHYPANDQIDRGNGARFFYHVHAASETEAQEHGHFHVFARSPVDPSRVAHMVGISLNSAGNAYRLFTTNQWVTAEQWLDGNAWRQILNSYSIQATGRLAPVARWINGIVRLYRGEILELLHQRDAVVRLHAKQQHMQLAAVLEDRRLQVTSEQDIALLDRIGSVLASSQETQQETT